MVWYDLVMDFVHKFVVYLKNPEALGDELVRRKHLLIWVFFMLLCFLVFANKCNIFQIVPPAFCLKHIGSMPTTIKLIVRNGYEIWLDLDKVNGKLIGMRRFYEDFGVQAGQTLLFVYVGGFDVNVCIFGFDDAEIDYPLIVHPLQKSSGKHGNYFPFFFLE